MEQYVIKGGNPLVGEVEIGGAKNAALAILSAAIMTDETILIENLPDVRDINVLLEAIAGIGAQVERIDRSTVKINGSTINDISVDYEYIKKIRASYYLLGALLGKYKHAEVPLPGGCNIGSRPIDQHLKGFRALGADVNILHGAIVAETENLHGSHIFLDVVPVGATINIMMAASMASGRTTIENAAREPHVVDVANFLNSMGANIKVRELTLSVSRVLRNFIVQSILSFRTRSRQELLCLLLLQLVGMLQLRMLSRNILRQQLPNLRRSDVRLKNLMMQYVYVQARDFTALMSRLFHIRDIRQICSRRSLLHLPLQKEQVS